MPWISRIISQVVGLAMIAGSGFGAAMAAPAPAGTLIQNQAVISYYNPALGTTEEVSTNIVVTRVNEVEAIEVRHDQTLTLTPDTNGQFSFFVANAGNVDISPAIDLTSVASDFTLEDVVITVDRNRNGIADPGEVELVPGGMIDLPIGSEAAIIVDFRTPATAQAGDQSVSELVATAGTASNSATGTVLIAENGLVLEKSVDRTTVGVGEQLTYTLRLRNRGFIDIAQYSSIDGEPIRIDGASASGVLVRDVVPLNTTLVASPRSADFTTLYHIAGTPDHSYVTTLPADISTVDAVAFFKTGNYPAGRSTDFAFDVVANNQIAEGYIPNTAQTWQSAGGRQVEVNSNTVRTQVSGAAGILTFTDEDGSTPITSTPLHFDVALSLSAGACNTTGAIDTVQVRIATDPEGDLETLTATETGPNTGVFQTPSIPVEREIPVNHFSDVLAAANGNNQTTATASAVCAGKTLSAKLAIGLGGVVFGSVNNVGIADAVVVVYDSTGTEIERVTTASNGFYSLSSMIAAGTYRIAVVPPDGYAFPSGRTDFTGWSRHVDAQASYGIPFAAPASFAGVDIPLDPVTVSPLQLKKTVDRTRAAPGDILLYTLTVTNDYPVALQNAAVRDKLPGGLSYIDGTARFDGSAIAASGSGLNLTFNLGTLLAGSEHTLTYMVQVSPVASGRLVNSAFVEGRTAALGMVRSDESSAPVRVVDHGVFADDGVVLGTVYIDFNGNGIRDSLAEGALDAGESVEPGVPGVRLHFSNGASVVTDADGKYSMPGLSSGSHAVAVAMGTLPETLVPATTTTRDALSPNSRLLSLLPGAVTGEYFALVPKAGVNVAETWDDLEARRVEHAERIAAIDTGAEPDRLNPGGLDWVDYPSMRVVGENEASSPTQTAISPLPDGADGDGVVTGGASALTTLDRTRNLEAEIRGLSPTLDFIDLGADTPIDSKVASIRIKGPAGGTLGLSVNGSPVDSSQIGQTVSFADGGVQAVEYVAVRLEGGDNVLEATFTDPFGNIRERKSVEVMAPGDPARLELIVPPDASAEAGSPIPILVRLVDANGVLTPASMDVTLEPGSGGRWLAEDIRATEPGVQVFVDRGEALIDYYPPPLPGTHRIAVTNGLGRFEAEMQLVADGSQRVIVGVVEGAVGFSDGIEPIGSDDFFGQTVRGVSGELYLRGKIKGDALLTLRYDSDKDSTERLFRDIDPDRYYPIYGDKSERGYDAQSRSQLYVKVEKGLNYLLYGDVDVAPQASEFQLGKFSRTLTGGRAHWENEQVSVDLFAGRTSQNRVVREFRAEGLSGPYDVNLSGLVEGSERVEVVTRDHRQPSVVLRTVALTRYTDYRLDYFSNALLLNAPVPAIDTDGNPNIIRISYEVDSGGDPYWVYSGEVRFNVNDNIHVGYREIHSDAEIARAGDRTIRAGYVSADWGKAGRGEVEIAHSVSGGTAGRAARVLYELVNDEMVLRLRASHVGEGFLEGDSISSGRDEALLSADWKGLPGIVVSGAALYDRAALTGDRRFGAELLADWSVNPELTATGGVRFLRRLPGDGSEAITVPSVVLGGDWQPGYVPGFSVSGEVEVNALDPSRLRALVEASHQAAENVRLYARSEWATAGSEFLDFAAADILTGSLTAGAEFRLNEDLAAFSELRSGSQTGVAAGMRGEWTVDGWLPGSEEAQVYATIEHFEPYDVKTLLGLPFGGQNDGQSRQTSLTAGYRTALGEDARLALGAELALKDGGYSAYGHQYWAQRSGDWSWAAENRLAWADNDVQLQVRDHLRAGAAYRPEGESIDGLAVAGVRFDDNVGDDMKNLSAYWSAGGSLALDGFTRLTARQAGQYQSLDSKGAIGESFMLLGQAGIERDFEIDDELRLRLGVNGIVFHDALQGTTFAGFGGELGFVPAENVLISAGYNWAPADLSGMSDIYTDGPYIKLSIKLDDSLWNFFDRAGLTVPADRR